MSQYAVRRFYRQPRAVMRQRVISLYQRLRRDDWQRAHRRYQQWPRLVRQHVGSNEYRLPIGAPGRVLWL